MRVLVTGASGQLGAYLVRRMLRGADEVATWSGSTRRWPTSLRRKT